MDQIGFLLNTFRKGLNILVKKVDQSTQVKNQQKKIAMLQRSVGRLKLGVVHKWFTKQGYGFITAADESDKAPADRKQYFVHFRELKYAPETPAHAKGLAYRDMVEFDEVVGESDRNLTAVNVRAPGGGFLTKTFQRDRSSGQR